MGFLKKLIYWLEQRPRTIWCLTIMYALLIFYLSSIPLLEPPTVKIPYLTTIGHIVEYTILGFLLLISFRSIKMDGVLAVISVAFLYGFSDEIHQIFTPGRFFDVWDIVADCIGALMGVFIGKYKRDSM